MPVNVNVLLAVKVLPSAIVSVDAVAGAVIVTLFIDVAVATPNVGVTRVGLVAITTLPVPVAAPQASYSASQSAAVVSVVPIQVKFTVVPGVTVANKLPPEEFTVILPVDAFSIS